jgi:polyribonucleotide nucleotidyltransferase
MFPKGIINDTQVICSVFSNDNNSEQGSWGITSASLGLLMAGAPFEGPVAGVKIVLNQDDSYSFDPSFEQEKSSKLQLVVAGTLDAITMVEAGANEVTNDQMLAALAHAHSLVKELCNAQLDFIADYIKQFGEIKKIEATLNNPDVSLYEKVQAYLTEEKLEALYNKGKKDFQHELDTLDIETKEYLLTLPQFSPQGRDEAAEVLDENAVGAMVYKRVKEIMRKNILENERRLDGRAPNAVRTIV